MSKKGKSEDFYSEREITLCVALMAEASRPFHPGVCSAASAAVAAACIACIQGEADREAALKDYAKLVSDLVDDNRKKIAASATKGIILQ